MVTLQLLVDGEEQEIQTESGEILICGCSPVCAWFAEAFVLCR